MTMGMVVVARFAARVPAVPGHQHVEEARQLIGQIGKRRCCPRPSETP
jgi:hypothetical protein